jgi:phosphatidylserine/phosphatidylglycerophosphate/cardiolipin synthase-like enzyme
MKRRADDPDPLGPLAPRAVTLELLSGRSLYERVVLDLVGRAKVSVWIATANVKELLVEPPEGAPRLHKSGTMVGRSARPARGGGRGSRPYVSVFEHFEALARRGVSVRILHSGVPSTAFAEELIERKALLRKTVADGEPALALRRCPRVHLKCVVRDGARLYVGSANWTGAGLGARGAGRRNFELGWISEDEAVLDEVQALYERIWSGAACAGCTLRAKCPQPIDELPPAR